MPNLKLASRAFVTMALFFLAPLSLAQPSSERLQVCAACHGEKGISSLPNTPSLAGQPKLFLENQMVLIREGLREIPEMKGLLDGVSDEELSSLASYFATLSPPPASASVDAKRFQRGEELAPKTLCASCHLSDYSGSEQIPRLAGQQEVFLLNAMKQFRDHPGPGRDTVMSASVHGLTDEQLADLAHFLAHFVK